MWACSINKISYFDCVDAIHLSSTAILNQNRGSNVLLTKAFSLVFTALHVE